MHFLQQLEEAASIPVDRLKDVIRKDKRVAKVLSTKPDLSDIDPAVFVPTIKYYLLNNREVLAYVEKRGDRRRFSKWTFKDLRKLTPETLTQDNLEELSQLVRDIFRDLTDYTKADLTADTYHELSREMSGSRGYYFDLSMAARLEIKSLGLQPKSKTLLYRGLFFHKDDLRDRSFGGTLNLGDGLKFLRSVRQGSRIVDLTWDKASAWTTDLATAKRYAQYHRHQARNQDGSPDQGHTDAELGFVISTLVDPKDVIVDYRLLADRLGWKPKDEIIVEPGTYRCRVVKKYTSEGEEDPTARSDDKLAELASSLELFTDIFEVPNPVPSIDLNEVVWLSENVLAIFGPHLKEMASEETERELKSSLQLVIDTYNQHLAGADNSMLSKAAGTPYEEVVHRLKKLNDTMRTVLRVDDGPKSVFEATPDQLWRYYKSTYKFSTTKELIDACGMARFTNWATGSKLASIASKVTNSYVKDLHRKSGAEQKKVVNIVLDILFKGLGEERPSTDAAAAKRLHEVAPQVEAAFKVLGFLQGVKSSLSSQDD